MPVRVKQCEVTGPFRLSVVFSDGTSGEHDFKSLIETGRGLIPEL